MKEQMVSLVVNFLIRMSASHILLSGFKFYLCSWVQLPDVGYSVRLQGWLKLVLWHLHERSRLVTSSWLQPGPAVTADLVCLKYFLSVHFFFQWICLFIHFTWTFKSFCMTQSWVIPILSHFIESYWSRIPHIHLDIVYSLLLLNYEQQLVG